MCLPGFPGLLVHPWGRVNSRLPSIYVQSRGLELIAGSP